MNPPMVANIKGCILTSCGKICIFTAGQRSCRKVMFSVVCAVSVHKGEGFPVLGPSPVHPPPRDMLKLVQLGPHCTGTPRHVPKIVHYIYVALTFRQAGSWLSTEVSCIVIILKIVCYNNENAPGCQVEVTCPAKKNLRKTIELRLTFISHGQIRLIIDHLSRTRERQTIPRLNVFWI